MGAGMAEEGLQRGVGLRAACEAGKGDTEGTITPKHEKRAVPLL